MIEFPYPLKNDHQVEGFLPISLDSVFVQRNEGFECGYLPTVEKLLSSFLPEMVMAPIA